jgi:hypothetical protein
MKADRRAGRKGLPDPVTLECGKGRSSSRGAFSTTKRRAPWPIGSELAQKTPVARAKNDRGSGAQAFIALWHFVRDGVVPQGVVLRPAH